MATTDYFRTRAGDGWG